MSTALRRGHSVSAHDLENLGKTAARLSETSGISLTEACTRTLDGEGLNQEQVRRAVEHANINAVNSKFASLRGDNRIVHLDHGLLFWGARHVDGRGFDTEANRPTNLQIPLARRDG